MIKKALGISISSLFLFGVAMQTTEILDTCNITEQKAKCKEALKPEYKYDASKATTFTFRTKKQFKELQVPLYVGEKYRFVFNLEGLPQDIDIEICDKKYESKHREVLFSSRDAEPGAKELVFDIEKSRHVFIDYIVPPTNDTIKKGCAVFALGYKLK